MGDRQKQDTSDNGSDAKKYNDRTLAAEPGGEPTGPNNGAKLDCSEGNVKEDGLELIIAKGLDDKRSESTNTTTGDGNGDDEEEPAPGLEIKNRFLNMVPLPLPGNNTHLIRSESFNSNNLFSVAKELRFHWGVGHEEINGDGVDNGKETTEKEDDLGLS